MAGHMRTGSVRLASGLTFGLVGVGGSLPGSLLSRAVPKDPLLLAFSALILVAAAALVSAWFLIPLAPLSILWANVSPMEPSQVFVPSRHVEPSPQQAGWQRLAGVVAHRLVLPTPPPHSLPSGSSMSQSSYRGQASVKAPRRSPW